MYWSAVVTRPQAEAKAIAHLERQDFTCWAPRFQEITVRRGRRIVSEKWLFPRYLFVLVVDRWRSILGTIGVVSIISFGEKPAAVPTSWVEEMRSHENRQGLVELPQKGRFRLGQQVQVTAGPFASLSGIYQGMNEQQREMVLLSLFGRMVRTSVAAEDLALV